MGNTAFPPLVPGVCGPLARAPAAGLVIALGAPLGNRTFPNTRGSSELARWPRRAAHAQHRFCRIRISADSVEALHGDGQNKAAAAKKLAIFVSGGGSNLRAIHAATVDGRLAASVEVSIPLKYQISVTSLPL